jgi:hypothetical protein
MELEGVIRRDLKPANVVITAADGTHFCEDRYQTDRLKGGRLCRIYLAADLVPRCESS